MFHECGEGTQKKTLEKSGQQMCGLIWITNKSSLALFLHCLPITMMFVLLMGDGIFSHEQKSLWFDG
jgi:hypothetical protein